MSFDNRRVSATGKTGGDKSPEKEIPPSAETTGSGSETKTSMTVPTFFADSWPKVEKESDIPTFVIWFLRRVACPIDKPDSKLLGRSSEDIRKWFKGPYGIPSQETFGHRLIMMIYFVNKLHVHTCVYWLAQDLYVIVFGGTMLDTKHRLFTFEELCEWIKTSPLIYGISLGNSAERDMDLTEYREKMDPVTKRFERRGFIDFTQCTDTGYVMRKPKFVLTRQDKDAEYANVQSRTPSPIPKKRLLAEFTKLFEKLIPEDPVR